MLLCLVTWLWYANPYLQYMFTVVLFITSGKRIRIMILLYCVILIYNMIMSLGMRLGLYLYAALQSFPYLDAISQNLSIIKPTLWGKLDGILSPCLSIYLSPAG